MVSTQNSSRIAWITGMKGLACYGVFLHHLLLALIPETFFGAPRSGFVWLLSSTPAGVIINGNFFVFVFITISAYLVGNSMVNYDGPDLRNKVGTFFVKRYFRLMLPILVYAVTRHVLVTFANRVFGSCVVPEYPAWSFVIRHSIYDTFAYADGSITEQLWMLSFLFQGSFLALLLSLPNRKTAKYWMILIYLAVFNLFEVSKVNYYLAAAISGVLLVDLFPLFDRLLDYKPLRWIPKVLILVGLFLGSILSTPVIDPISTAYQQFTEKFEFYHYRGAFILLLGLLGEYALSKKADAKPKLLIKVLESKPLQFLGTISYSVYLIHDTLLVLWASRIQNFFLTLQRLSLGWVTLATVLLMSIITIALSWLFYQVVEKNTNKLCRYIKL